MPAKHLLLACASAVGAALSNAPAHSGTYNYTEIQIGFNQYSCASGLNDKNYVVGEYYGAGSAPFGPFLYYPNSSYFEFATPAGSSELFACNYIYPISSVNNKNLTVSTYAISSAHPFAAFTWSPVSLKTKKLPFAARLTIPTAINDSGTVVGTASKVAPFIAGHGFAIAGGAVTLFDPPGSTNTVPLDIAADGTIVGWFQDTAGTHGFILPSTGTYTVVDVPGSTETVIRSINTNGEVAGKYYDTTVGHYRGFTRSGTNILTYQFPGAGDTEILRTLPSGLRIGNYTDSSSVVHGFSYLPVAYTTLDAPGGVAIRIQSVNNNGNFVGNGAGDGTGAHGFVAVCPPHSGVCLH